MLMTTKGVTVHRVVQYFAFPALWWATLWHPLELLDYKWATHFRRLCSCAASGSQIRTPRIPSLN